MVTSRCSWEPFGRQIATGKRTCVAVEVDEDPIVSLVLQALNCIGEMRPCSLVDRGPRTFHSRVYFEVLIHDRALPKRRGELVDSGAEPRPQRRSRSIPTSRHIKLDCVEYRLFCPSTQHRSRASVALFRGDPFSFDALGDAVADRFVDVAPILERA